MKVLLDTNAYSALKRGRPEVVARVHGAHQVVLSSVVLGELVFGFRNGSRYEQNKRQLEQFLRSPHVRVRAVTQSTAEHFGRIAAQLRRKGTPIPTNDIWIAAHAMESSSELLSYDHHFDKVEDLRWVLLPLS